MPETTEYSPRAKAIPGLPQSVEYFVQSVRLFMRDYPELNRLTKGEESSDRMIVWAIIHTVDDFNSTPPLIGVSWEEIPKSILLYGVVATLLDSVIMLSTRNHLAYSDGGINVNLDKSGLLMQLRQMVNGTYEQKKDRYKIALNISRGFGNVSSEYWIVNGSYGAW